MKNQTRQFLSRMGLDTRTIDALACLPDFIDAVQIALEHEQKSTEVNGKVRESVSLSQELSLIHKTLDKVCERLEIKVEELEEYDQIVERAKK